MHIRILSFLLVLLCLVSLPVSAASRPLDGTENILLLGMDELPGEGIWRTDTIIVIAVDWHANRLGLLSVPRDLFVDIPGAARNRINTVDFIGEQRDGPGGGPALLSTVLSQTLGIRTQYYMRTDMDQVSRLIDELGGITVVLDEPFTEDVPDPDLLAQGQYALLGAGSHHMDGATALAYARARYMTGDLDRNRRQQQVMWAVAQRLKEQGLLMQPQWLWSRFNAMGQTDLPLLHALSLAWFGAHLQPEDVHTLTFDYNLARPWTTEQGAQVLLLADREQVDAWVDGLFNAPCLVCRGPASAAPPLYTVEIPPPRRPGPSSTRSLRAGDNRGGRSHSPGAGAPSHH